MDAVYDKIGIEYDTTRKVDPVILSELKKYLEIDEDKKYLDVACGTGNYTCEISKTGSWSAFDCSEMMLQNARLKNKKINWSNYSVENIGYDSKTFDGAICTLAIHHFPDLVRAFSEVSRVLKDNANFVIFTSTPAQMKSYWLCHYFPNMMDLSCKQMPGKEIIETALESSCLRIKSYSPFYITSELTDFFLYSGKQRPEMYLSSSVRKGISSFQKFCSSVELKSGLAELEKDIVSGKINQIIKKYDNAAGDYLFIKSTKI